jgi:uncharacterized membrane protein YphA (DoxX/SURF4 family)
VSQRPRMPRQRTARDGAAGRQPSAGRPGAVTAKGTAVQLSSLRQAAGRASAIAAEWTPTVSRVLLGLVLAWFGYHELIRPGEWTGYVPVFSPGSSLAIVLVLAHGWILLVLAAALVAGIAPRAAAAIAAVMLIEIVISLTATGGLSDLTLRDVGVLGLAVGLTGCTRHRLVLRG